MEICGCSDYSVYELQDLDLEELVEKVALLPCEEWIKLALCSMIKVCPYTYEGLTKNGTKLVDMCIQFLLIENSLVNIQKTKPDDIHPNKYITIWSFVYDFLKITANSGFDYWLLNYLEFVEYQQVKGVMEHGSGIRCGYLKDSIQVHVDQEFKKKVQEWVDNME